MMTIAYGRWGALRGEEHLPSNTINRRWGQHGFTLIELMVVMTILALLAVLVVPKLVGRSDEARVTATKVQIRNIESALQLYKLDNGIYPTTEQGLEALVTQPATSPVPTNWKQGGYLPKVPLDPWKRPYVYLSPGVNDPDYDILSFGADGESGGEGPSQDIASWNIE
ncbi:MAG: type II secretion system major pseudopilin GspG [Nitrospirota bacterium]